VFRAVGLIGLGEMGERKGALRLNEGRAAGEAWAAAAVLMLRESLGFMARDAGSILAVWMLMMLLVWWYADDMACCVQIGCSDDD
jgi:hypothetical protein